VRVRASRPCLLGIDLGTGSTKAVLVDDSGQTVGVGVSANEVRSPRPGWVESDPEAWWASTCNAVGRALSAATTGDRPPQVVGIGLSGQMHGAVLVGADARPLGPAVLWADQRALAEADRYRALPEALRQAVGNPVAPGMTGPVLLWLEANEPERYGSARWALVAKDWLRARLTGELASDPSDASGTLLADLERRAWSPEVTGALGLRPSLLPPILASDALGGSLLASAASALRLAAGLPVAVGAGDTAAALVGQGPPGLGVVVLNVGTGAQAVVRRLRPEPDERLRYHVFAEAGSGYFALAAVQAAGLAFEWAWRALGCDWAEAYRLLGEAPSGARGVVFVPHLAGSRSPDMAPRASGGFVGARLPAPGQSWCGRSSRGWRSRSVRPPSACRSSGRGPRSASWVEARWSRPGDSSSRMRSDVPSLSLRLSMPRREERRCSPLGWREWRWATAGRPASRPPSSRCRRRRVRWQTPTDGGGSGASGCSSHRADRRWTTSRPPARSGSPRARRRSRRQPTCAGPWRPARGGATSARRRALGRRGRARPRWPCRAREQRAPG